MRPRLLKGIPEKQNRLVSNKNFQAAMCRFFILYGLHKAYSGYALIKTFLTA